MASPAIFARSILLLLSLFLVLSPSEATRGIRHKRHVPVPPRLSAEGQAERLIRALNLFPNKSVNVLPADPFPSEQRLVEKRIELPLSGDSGSSVADLGQHAGYFLLPNTKGARMFYFFFESRKSRQDPVVIWLTGGPGCGSELALFYENGPFKVGNDLTLSWNDYGWDKAANIIYVDQPTGTGFSYTTDESDIRHDETGVSDDLYAFLQEFFTKHPEYAVNDFYITGESYAGHYIPAFATRVHKGNQIFEGIQINLKGFAIGNGMTNPGIQFPAYTDYALYMKLIDEEDYLDINARLAAPCRNSSDSCSAKGGDACDTAKQVCGDIFNEIIQLQGGSINYYDIRKPCVGSLCYDFSNMERLLNSRDVKTALGVRDIEYVSCSTAVYAAMSNDMMLNLDVGIPALLEDGIDVLIYAGEYDLICNWMGNSGWVHAMNWSGQSGFQAAGTVPFKVNDKEVGVLKNYGKLSFLRVHDSGHMVPMDQPNASLEMVSRWMAGSLVRGTEQK